MTLHERGERLMAWAVEGYRRDARRQRWIWAAASVGMALVAFGDMIFAQAGGAGGVSRADATRALQAGLSLMVVVRWATYIVGSIFVLWGFGSLERGGWIKIIAGGLMVTWELWLALVATIASGGFSSQNEMPTLR